MLVSNLKLLYLNKLFNWLRKGSLTKSLSWLLNLDLEVKGSFTRFFLKSKNLGRNCLKSISRWTGASTRRLPNWQPAMEPTIWWQGATFSTLLTEPTQFPCWGRPLRRIWTLWLFECNESIPFPYYKAL